MNSLPSQKRYIFSNNAVISILAFFVFLVNMCVYTRIYNGKTARTTDLRCILTYDTFKSLFKKLEGPTFLSIYHHWYVGNNNKKTDIKES